MLYNGFVCTTRGTGVGIADTQKNSLSEKFSKAVAAGITAATLALSAGTALATAPGERPQAPEQQTAWAPRAVPGENHWTPEQRKVYEDVQRDLHNAGIKSATFLAPFPVPNYRAIPAEFVRWPDKKTGKTDTLVIGAGASVTEWFQRAHADDCSTSVFVNNSLFERARTFVYLHETGHKLDYALGLTKPVREAMDVAIKGAGMKNVPDKDLPENLKNLNTNIQERYADTTATLYALSNMKDPKPLVNAWYNLREASVLETIDPTHNTASSIKYAMDAYEKNPRPGLSIVDAAKWSAKLIGQEQDMIIRDQNRWLPTRVLEGSIGRLLTGAPTSFDVKANTFMNGGDYQSAQKNWYSVKKSEEGLCAAPQEQKTSAGKPSARTPHPG